MARSACDIASAFLMAWPAARWSALKATDHFHTCPPMPCTTAYSMSRCFMAVEEPNGGFVPPTQRDPGLLFRGHPEVVDADLAVVALTHPPGRRHDATARHFRLLFSASAMSR
jgi:hypothetical protein